MAADVRREGREGSVMLIVFIVLLLASFLGMSLLYTTDTDFRAAKNYSDSLQALTDGDSAVNEVVWRLNLKPGAGAPPTGSKVSVNDLVNYDAAIPYDPQGILTNGVDDDADGVIDEPDELNLARDWTARVLLTPNALHPGAPWEVADPVIATGPPWGSQIVVATIQPWTTWRLYSTADPDSSETLNVRFKLDTDTSLGDSENDGPEIVFFDPFFSSNHSEEKNTLSALGGDANPRDDSPYNITWSDGAVKYPASGNPVMLVTTTARIERGGHVVSRRKIEAEVYKQQRAVHTKAMCGCTDLTVSGGGTTDSYKSSQGNYGVGPTYQNGDIGVNGNLTLAGGAYIYGNAEASGTITFNGAGATVQWDAIAGGAIGAGNVLGNRIPNKQPTPLPCDCSVIDADAAVNAAKITNDNGTITPSAYRAVKDLKLNAGKTIILSGGTYYFDSIDITAGGSIQIGVDTNGDGVVDGPPTSRVNIFVSGDLHLGGQGTVNTFGRPTDLAIVSSAVPNDDVTLDGGSEFRGTIFAPKTDITVNGSNTVKGALLGKNVKNTGGAPVHYDEDLMKSWIVPGPVKVVAWHEVW